MIQGCLHRRCEWFTFNGLRRQDITSATNSCVFAENVHFTDV